MADDLARTQSRNVSVVDLVSRTYLALNQPEKGIELYRGLQNKFPQSPEIHQRLGQALATLNRLDDARTAFDRAISANQSFISAWRNRILLELKAGGFDEAMNVVNKAVAQNAKNDEARLLEGDLFVAANRLPEAEKSYAKVLAENPSPMALSRVFRTVLQRGDRQRAHAVLVDWLRVKPDDPGALMALAEDYLSSKDYKAAITQYEILLKKFPKNALILNNLATAYDEVNDPRALDVASQAFQLQPMSPDINDTYGYLLYRKGDAQRGAKIMYQAYVAAPKNPQIVYHLAKVRADAKDFEGARSLLKPIIDAKLEFGEAEEARQLYTKLGGG